MPTPPRDLTVVSLTTACARQLKFWIDAANREAGGTGKKRLMTKQGKVQELCKRLAAHYHLDLSMLPPKPVPAGPSVIDADIQQRQWDDWLDLVEEWQEKGDSFCLCEREEASLHPHLSQQVAAVVASAQLPTGGPPSAQIAGAAHPSPETVHAQLQAAQEGDVNALAALLQLQAAITHTASVAAALLPVPFPPPIASTVAVPAVASTAAAAPLPVPLPPPATLTSVPAAVSTSADGARDAHSAASILSCGEIDIAALNRATDLRGVIQQFEDGDVQRIQERYGPQEGRPTEAMWANIKGTINRRERVWREFRDEFGADKDQFFGFFTTAVHGAASSRKRKPHARGSSPELVPYRLVAQAIPHRDCDIGDERKCAVYRDGSGMFSDALWEQKWGGLNLWEIWRVLGKERY